MPIKLVIFDWDGTLMDSAAMIVNCFNAATRDVGLPQRGAREVRQIIGLSLHDAFKTLIPRASPDQRSRLIERYRAHFLTLEPTAMPLFPGVTQYLRELYAQRYLLAVASGKSRRGLEKALNDTGTTPYFVSTRCADEALSKPHPQMVLDILQDTGISPREAIVVGDTVFDLQMAMAARVDAVAVTYGVHELDQLRQHQPLACVNSFPEVYEWINRQSASSSAEAMNC